MARNVAAVPRRSSAAVALANSSCASAARSRADHGSATYSSLDRCARRGGITDRNLISAPMAKITFIGAGSTVFARNLLGDILGREELAGSEIALFDIDPERLATSELVAHRVVDALG